MKGIFGPRQDREGRPGYECPPEQSGGPGKSSDGLSHLLSGRQACEHGVRLIHAVEAPVAGEDAGGAVGFL